ncbi:hypothetical protein N510_001563 [Firmicutes bacterium ASF500]|nr:hypothetical protein N510_001563 [Firmicutes bacterium ASF500]
MENAIYIVFSATPTGMGKLIRGATRNRYNHVSLSLSRDIHKMYTFARLHRTIPLYGGFVVESILRYQSFAGTARVKICRVEVPEPQFTYLRNYLDRLWNEREEYIYNTPAALASLVHLRPAISKAHTCVTFVQNVLSRYLLAGVTEGDSPTVRSLERRLTPYVIYEGPAPAASGEWGEDAYPAQTTTRYAVYTTARHFGRLAKRVLGGIA